MSKIPLVFRDSYGVRLSASVCLTAITSQHAPLTRIGTMLLASAAIVFVPKP